VDEAHHMPPAGFKYLVTEMLCWAAGGPQHYSGRSMEEARRDWRSLPVSGKRSWTTCMPAAEQAEVKAFLESTRGAIVAPVA
jgi:hemoglobin